MALPRRGEELVRGPHSRLPSTQAQPWAAGEEGLGTPGRPPGASEGWARLENLPGSCPLHATQCSQGQARSRPWGAHSR